MMRQDLARVAASIWGLLLVLLCCPAAFGAGDANVAACPNDGLVGFAVFLPDCRAFEPVTPAFTVGREALGFEISSDGSRVLELNEGAFAGSGSDSGGMRGLAYEGVRSPTSWLVSSVTPPSSLLPAEEVLAASPDLEQTLWFAHSPGESQAAENAYVRKPDGTVVEVGPLVPPADTTGPSAREYQQFGENRLKYVDASRDLSRVLFTMNVAENQFWPEDTTFRGLELTAESLYEYAGVGNTQPMLVGVSDGSTLVAGKKLPAGHLISECATNLGSRNKEDVYNAISGNGESVFFTAVGRERPFCGLGAVEDPGLVAPVVSELYARVDGAQTVAISEPTAGDCAACLTPATEGEGRRPGEFAGASADGSKVLFLTEQELFAGDATMNLYLYDFANPAGEKIVRVSSGSAEPRVLGVMRISEDGSHVYFVAEGALTGGQENANHEVAELGADNMYVYERDTAHPAGQLTFIGKLASGDSQTWQIADRREVQATPDGRFVVFASSAHLVPGDVSGPPQIFEYDSLTGEMVRVSAGEQGEQEAEASANNNESRIPEPQVTEQATPASEGVAVSDDGGVVVFSSLGLLSREAIALREPGVPSFYEYRSAREIGDGGVFLLSGAKGAGVPHLLGMDSSGANVFFETAAGLAGRGGVSAEKVFDARVDGGFPLSVGGGGCVGEGCLGAVSGVPVFSGGESGSVVGGGNAPAAVAPPKARSRSAAQVRAARLAGALRVCRRVRGARKRSACEKRARRVYGRGK